MLNGLIREDDEVLEVWYLLGWCYHQMKELSSSRSCLSKVIEVSYSYKMKRNMQLYSLLLCSSTKSLIVTKKN